MSGLRETKVGNLIPNLFERLITILEHVTYRFWWKAFAIAPRLDLKKINIIKNKKFPN